MRCKGCKAKDAHIASLMEQIEWLRAHAGTPTPKHSEGVAQDEPRWYSEEEEEVAALKQAGLLDVTDAEAALAQVGALNTNVYVEE